MKVGHCAAAAPGSNSFMNPYPAPRAQEPVFIWKLLRRQSPSGTLPPLETLFMNLLLCLSCGGRLCVLNVLLLWTDGEQRNEPGGTGSPLFLLLAVSPSCSVSLELWSWNALTLILLWSHPSIPSRCLGFSPSCFRLLFLHWGPCQVHFLPVWRQLHVTTPRRDQTLPAPVNDT